MTVLIGVFLDYGRPWGAIAYITGALLSALAGFIGMTVATMANARTAQAAQTGGAREALPLAFRGGAVMGFTVAGLSLLGLAVSYVLYVDILEVDDPFAVLTAFGLGASSIALFSRVGGGIYTKAADVGADLVGKVEAGIPEDDPRNPATIADNVGDNVGDVAGMGADLFESYSGAIIAPIALAAFLPGVVVNGRLAGAGDAIVPELFVLPLAIAGAGMIASIIGAFMVKSSGSTSVHDLGKALHRGTNTAAAITVVAVLALSYAMLDGSDLVEEWWGLPISVIGGLLVGYAIGKVAEVWTSDEFGPVKKIAAQTETGPATTILGGISAGMVSVAASVLLVVTGIGVAYWGGEQALEGLGIYGVALAAIGMLATTGVVVSVDAYGPIADNAGGIAEMAHLPPEVREVTDSLDSLGNTTAAVAKGFAVGSAALTALALFKAFEAALLVEGHSLNLDVGQVEVFIGLFLGAMLPFLFAALTIDAVGRAANKMIEEVRRQFREIPGLREGKEGVEPEYAKWVDISTAAALKEMLIPGGLAIVVPLVIGFIDVDALDSLGNTTAAIAKGFAVGSAALTALALFKSFEVAVNTAAIAENKDITLSLDVGEVEVFVGLFLGAMLPFLFASLTISAVGRAAQKMIEEVRRQFREIPGLREGEPGVRPDSARCVAISTQASLREMLIPGALAIVVPLVIGFVNINALGGFLAGALVSGFALAIFMANAGGAWDNAKKYIEAGNHGGKGSDPHKAAVVGDTVGDPFKDTSGPAMNILIKVMTIVSLVFASAFVAFA
jgi:H(+)-translocating pyrophosphatase